MSAYTQDTWILNVSYRAETDQDKRGWYHKHYCRIELPSELSVQEAKLQADVISTLFQADTVQLWDFTLTRWELRGHPHSF